jgi:broad specificity phosphatase PhoE
LLADRLRAKAVQVVYTSSLNRALETTEIVAEMLQVPTVVDERLRERGVGDLTGLNREEIESQFPEWLKQWEESRRIPAPGGEPTDLFWQRVSAVFGEIVGSYPNGDVAVVTHGGVLQVYLSQILGMDQGYSPPFSFGNCSISEVEITERGIRVLVVNDQCHLDREGEG